VFRLWRDPVIAVYTAERFASLRRECVATACTLLHV
jgi:hypothetical protein